MSRGLAKIVSGGQTGVDGGVLDAALAAEFPCGGWFPADRSAEDGPIPARYPLTPLARGGYRERTRQNVLDSGGTAAGSALHAQEVARIIQRVGRLLNAAAPASE
jgi:hypothetical protein